MTSKWSTITLNEIVEHQKGFAFKSKDYVESGTPVVRVSNFTQNSIDTSDLKFVNDEIAVKNKTVTLLESDVVIATVGSWPTNPASVVGKTIRVPHSVDGSLLNQNAVRLRVKNKSLSDQTFLYYLLKSQDFADYIVSTAQGSASQASITLKDIYGYELQYPNEFEREIIGNHLASIDKKISNNQQTNQTLEEMAQAIFKSWFVDFDPVKAKMNGELPEGMDAATASLFPEKLVESELGLIPEGWGVGTLSNVAKYCSARTNIDTITLENYISTENMLAEKKGVTVASKLPTAKTVAAYKSGDILVSNIRPYFKKIWLAEGSGGRSNDVLGFESVSKNTDSYLMNLLYQDTFFEYMTRTSKGAKMPRGDKTAIMNWEMAVPPVELREAFSAIVDKFYQLIPQNRAQNASLESLRDTLLPKLLSGEIELETK
ncbi:restriction endonuclease subunit S [Shewanella intestini]|uniref:Restriction endonuclease subunit S n=1 Tax=Shewanella intestini TaxID=2017544 RepID=A0ABS5I3Q8_9GAMM|nr:MULTISPECIES: restriction endonuclease subunit S [Shewanella]MBR9728005.1 restriction endonuclease subunit S [Shewanella intestini]MRG36444.1 restriction endonuclease subunit S [Shewanella sp. XMDDZSB0408]